MKSINQRIFIRTDGNSEIGSGHIVRCIAMAEMLKTSFVITFFCRAIPEIFKPVLRENGFELVSIGDEQDFIGQVTSEIIVVLDGYQFDSDYQLKVKSFGAMLVCVDDLHDKRYYADLIINHAPGISAGDYCAQSSTQFALGPAFALLRSPFLRHARERSAKRKSSSVLICFGGSDANNLTATALRTIVEFNLIEHINVVVGAIYSHMESLIQSLKDDRRVRLHKGLPDEDMAKLFLENGIAIVPASGLLMEAVSIGNIIISGMSASNQRFMYESFKAAKCFIDAEHFSMSSIRKALKIALANEFSKVAIIDGQSGQRLLRRFTQLSISRDFSYRKVNEGDLLQTFKWANNPQVRMFSFGKKEISWEEHVSWFQDKIDNDTCFFYVVYLGTEVVGAVRYDVDGKDAVISFLIDPIWHGKGYGIGVLAGSLRQVTKDSFERPMGFMNFVAYVMRENVASMKIFSNLGFEQIDLKDKIKFVKSVLWNSCSLTQ